MPLTAAADGSSLANPGPSGWAWYIDDERWHAGGWPHGTNNMGELMAVLDLLQETKDVADELVILCDSQYVINSVTKWMPGWKRAGWVKRDKKPVMNVELLQEIDAALAGRDVRFEWVKGHAGHELNEAADNRARAAATAYRDGTEVLVGPGYSELAPSSEPTDLNDADVAASVDVKPAAIEGADASAEPSEPKRRRAATAVGGAADEGTPSDETSSGERQASRRAARGSLDPAATPARTAGAADDRDEPIHEADLRAIVEREQELLSDEVRASRELSAALLHADFAEIGSSGRVYTRDEMLDSLAPLPNPVTLEVIDCSPVGPGTVLLLWRATGRGWTVNRSSLWVRTGSGWQLRFHQGTRA